MMMAPTTYSAGSSPTTSITAGASSDLPSLHQVVALTLSYRRIFRAWVFAPKWLLLLHFGFCLAFWLLQCISGGFAVLALLLAAGLLALAYNAILNMHLTNSKASLDAALEKNQVRFPIVALTIGCVLARVWIGPSILAAVEAAPALGLGRIGLFLCWSPGIASFVQSLRLCGTIFLLGLAVVARYFGPQSIMRCSSVPLVVNPYMNTLYSWWSGPILNLASDTPGELLTFSFGGTSTATTNLHNTNSNREHAGSRFMLSTVRSILAQLAVSVLVGTALGFGKAIGWFPGVDGGDDVFARTCTVFACVFTVMGSLCAILPAHELDPKRYNNVSTLESSLPESLVMMIIKNSLPSALISSTTSVILFIMTSPDKDTEGCWTLFVQLTVYCTLLSCYLSLLDEGVKLTLFKPALDLNRMVEELYDDATPLTILDVIMHCLLYEQTSFVTALSTNVQKSSSSGGGGGGWGLEEQERRRLEVYTKKLANYMLSLGMRFADAPLEQDVLRVAVLSSLFDTTSSTVSNSPMQTSSRRHSCLVQELLNPKFPTNVDGKQNCWYLCLPLVRALCVFIGATGEVLLLCSGSTTRTKTTSTTPGSVRRISAADWSLPPGLYVCAEHAVRALSQCISESMVAFLDWKSSDLSILVPAALESIFCLRKGVIAFTSQTQIVLGDKIEVADTTKSLVQTCDRAASDILACLTLPSGLGRIDLGLDEDCSLWAKSLIGTVG